MVHACTIGQKRKQMPLKYSIRTNGYSAIENRKGRPSLTSLKNLTRYPMPKKGFNTFKQDPKSYKESKDLQTPGIETTNANQPHLNLTGWHLNCLRDR